MQWHEACALLGIQPTPPNVYDIGDRETLRRQYRKQSLRLHPDKNPAPDAADQFQRMHDAYLWLDSAIEFGHGQGLGQGQDNDAPSHGIGAALAQRMWSWLTEVCETELHDRLVKWIDRFDKDTLARVHELLSKLPVDSNVQSVLDHIRALLASTIHAKQDQDVHVVLRPTLTDLLQDHVYRLRVPPDLVHDLDRDGDGTDDRVFLVPLWVDEVVYDLGNGRDLVVTCVPDLPDHVVLDEHQHLHISQTVRIGDVWGQGQVDVLWGYPPVRLDRLRLSPEPQTVLVSSHGVPIAASGGKKSSGAEVYKVGRRGSIYARITLVM